MTNPIKIYDIGIVGYGPASITAAIYGARKKLSVILVGEVPGGEIVTSGEIENWPGDGNTDGLVLSEKFVNHLQLHAEDVTTVPAHVDQVSKEQDELFTIQTNDGKYRSRTLIYAAGRHPRLLEVPGEKEYKNKGVTYCAVCDAPLFQGKDVAVIGGGDSGAEAVIMLQRIARSISLLHIAGALKADPILLQAFAKDPKVSVILNANTTAIKGSKFVEQLEYVDTVTGDARTLPVEGIFVTIGAIPNTDPVKDLLPLDQFGAIPADRYGRTSLEGFFAAGDVTDVRDAQIVVASGMGCSASLSASDYVSRHPSP